MVFGIDALRLRVFRSDVAQRKDAEYSCRNVSGASARAIARIEPLILYEFSAPVLGFGNLVQTVNFHQLSKPPHDFFAFKKGKFIHVLIPYFMCIVALVACTAPRHQRFTF